MKLTFYIHAIALLCLTITSGAIADEKRPLVFVINGESNSGGVGRNTKATPKEMASRASVQILELTSGKFQFENLQLGVNNLRDHFGFAKSDYSIKHGFENELANAVESGKFPGHESVHLIKTGQGGSRISQWAENSPSKYWEKFLQRIKEAKKQLPNNPQWVVWFSLGINDAIAKTPIEPWEKQVRDHLKHLQEQLPGAIIVMTEFQSMGYPETNTAIARIAADTPDVYAIDSTGAELVDRNHWSYAGLKTVTQRMIKATNQATSTDPYIWAIRAGGDPAGEKVRSLAVGEDGFTYITGQFSGEADFGTHQLTSRGGPDCFIAKIDTDGKFIWARQIGGDAIERGYGIDADAQGHVFVTGHFQSKTLTFAGKKITNAGDYDAFTASFDKDGNERWIHTGGGPAYDYGHGLDLMPGGGCVIAGRMVGPAALGENILEAKEKATRLFVARYSDEGKVVWAKAGGAPISASADDVAVDSTGNVWVCGRAYKNASYGGALLGDEKSGSFMVAKISGKDGSLIQATRFGGATGGHLAGVIPDEVNGGCYACGAFEGEITVGSEKLVSLGDKDVLVAHLDKTGSVDWIRSGGGPGWDLALGIGIDKEGNVLVTGFVNDKGNFGQGSKEIIGAAREGFVASYDHKGKLLWLVENGGSANEINEDVAEDKDGNIVNGGGFQTTGIFGHIKLTARTEKARSQDIFVTKFRKP